MSETDAALRAFALRDASGFPGLPEGTTLEQATAVWDADPGRFGRWFLGESQAETFYCPVDLEGYDGQVRIWFRDGLVVKVQGDGPQMDAGVVNRLGEPEDRLDFRMDTLVVEGGERVYAARGIAVQLNRTEDLVVSWSVFAPTTAARYREGLRAAGDYRESPAPGSAWQGEA